MLPARLAFAAALLLIAAGCSGPGSTASAPVDLAPPSDPEARLLEVVGATGESPEAVYGRLLSRAASLARDQGHDHVAVLEKRIDEVPGSAAAKPRFSARIPIVRSRSRGGGAMTAIDLDRVAAYRAQAVVRPYSGPKPVGAEEVYRVEAGGNSD